MLIGMGLYKTNFYRAHASARLYLALMAIAILVALPAIVLPHD